MAKQGRRVRMTSARRRAAKGSYALVGLFFLFFVVMTVFMGW
jgi:hypothetical protein